MILTPNDAKKYFDELVIKHGEEKAKELARRLIADESLWPKNIIFFCLFCFPHIFTIPIPQFFFLLYKLLRSTQRYRGLAIPRGFGKTTILNLVYIVYNVITHRKHYQIIVTQSATKGEHLIQAIKNEFEHNVALKYLYGELSGIGTTRTWTTQMLEFEDGMCVRSFGVGQSIRGEKYLHYRPDLINFDDIEDDDSVRNPEIRKKTKWWMLKQAIPALAPNGELNFIGTILHYDSLLKNIIDKKEEFASWDVLFLQAITPDKIALWPERLSIDRADKMMHDPTDPNFCGSLVFAQEYMNEPTSDDVGLIKMSWIKGFSFTEADARFRAMRPREQQGFTNFMEVYGGIDPAISQKDRADYFAFVTVAYDKDGVIGEKGKTYVIDYYRGHLTIDKQVEKIIELYLTWKHWSVRLETVAYQEALYQLLKQKMAEQKLSIPLKTFKPDKDKQRRMMFHSARVENGMVSFRQDHPLWLTFRDELLQFPVGVNDDMVDAYMMADEYVAVPKVRTWSAKPSGF